MGGEKGGGERGKERGKEGRSGDAEGEGGGKEGEGGKITVYLSRRVVYNRDT